MILKQIFIIIAFLMLINFANANEKNLFPSFDFENRAKLSVYPPGTSGTIKTDKNIFKFGKASARIDIPKIQDKMTLYTYVRLLPDKNYIISFWYKTKNWQRSDNYSTKIILRFNRKNGDNGSAGRYQISFPTINKHDSKWKKFTTEFQSPSDVYMCQLAIFSAHGVKGMLWLDNVKLEQVVDFLKVSKVKKSPKIDGKLDDPCWKNAIALNNFYRTNYKAKPVLMQTTAYLCYDNKNIYVAFKNIEPKINKVKATITERDGPVWNDDCNEIFLMAPNGKVRQFIVNTANVKWDGELYMRVPGDPCRPKTEWNGKWQSAIQKGKNEWTTEVAIPFSDFKYGPKGLWRLNLARERHGAAVECSHWNRVDGKLNNVNKFGFLKFNQKSASLSRFVEKIVENPFHIKRQSAKFKELLSEEPGNYIVGSWAHGYHLGGYPKSFQANYSPEKGKLEQEQYLAETGRAGMFGPAFPWVVKLIGGMAEIRSLNKKYGMKFPLMAQNSSMSRKAVKNGAVYINTTAKHAVPDPVDPAIAQVVNDELKSYLKKHSAIIPYLVVINGEDEPTNNTYKAFSFTSNAENKKSLKKLDAKIKHDFGFSKFGLYDYYDDVNSERQSAFNHIAFWSWWSEEYCKIRKKDKAVAEQLAPEVPYLINFNSCSSFRYLDFTRISTAMHWIGCDPYPTATMAFHGRNRALYHTGFSTKLIHDSAAPGVKTCIMPQGFVYHGRGPSPENIREWASQAIKNGASILYWYTLGPLRITIPESYKEMLRVNKLISSMNKLKLPKKTVTALFFSQTARCGVKDEAQYSLYTLYVLLGEKLKTWFKFVNETMLKMDMDSLDSYRLVYVPELKYTDNATAEKLLIFVENGGILVLFDPESFMWNVNGERMTTFRSKLLGAPLGKPCTAGNIIMSKNYLGLKKGVRMPLTKIRGRRDRGTVLAFNVQPPGDANIFATYASGKPAAYERKIGKGKVIYFAAQPFGNAQLATCNSSWKTFLSGLAKEVGELESLAIWDFLLPSKGGEVAVKYIVQPPK